MLLMISIILVLLRKKNTRLLMKLWHVLDSGGLHTCSGEAGWGVHLSIGEIHSITVSLFPTPCQKGEDKKSDFAL